MTETQLQRSIIEALQKMGVWVIRTAVSKKRGRGFTGEDGMPDLHVVHYGPKGESGWLEVKRPGETLNENQVIWHDRARQAGVRVATVTSPIEAWGVVLDWRKS